MHAPETADSMLPARASRRYQARPRHRHERSPLGRALAVLAATYTVHPSTAGSWTAATRLSVVALRVSRQTRARPPPPQSCRDARHAHLAPHSCRARLTSPLGCESAQHAREAFL